MQRQTNKIGVRLRVQLVDATHIHHARLQGLPFQEFVNWYLEKTYLDK